MTLDFSRRQRRETNHLTARKYRRQQHRRTRRDQDQVRGSWRLFEHFQERISRSVVELVSLVDQKHARLAFKRSKVRLLFDLPHLLDAQHALRRDDEPDVWMVRPDDLRPLVRIVTRWIVQPPDANTRRTDTTDRK